MEDEPASKKLKTEDSLVPEEEFLRRNKVSDTRVPAMVIMPSWGVRSCCGSTLPAPPCSAPTPLASGARVRYWRLGRASERPVDAQLTVKGAG